MTLVIHRPDGDPIRLPAIVWIETNGDDEMIDIGHIEDGIVEHTLFDKGQWTKIEIISGGPTRNG